MANEKSEPGAVVNGQPQSNSTIFTTLIARRKWQWVKSFLALLVLFLLFAFLVFPQWYSSSVSLSVQTPTPGGSIAGLLSLGSAQRKYIGVLKSRTFIEQAEKVADLKDMYELKRPSDVLEKYARCVKVDDNVTDGLIYITVTLDAPPAVAINAGDRREKVRTTAALIASTYYKSFIDYLENVDTDKETVLLRAATGEVAKARANYDKSITALVKFVKDRRIKASTMPSFPSPAAVMSGESPLTTPSTDIAQAAQQFVALVGRKAQLEAQLKAADVLHSRLQALLSGPLTDVAAIPGEDPLLIEARRSYTEARRNYDTLKVQLGAENPRLISAKANMDIAERKLRGQIRAVLKGDTTESLNLASLRASYEVASRQVADTERNFQTSKELTTDLGQRMAEVGISLKVLEAAMTGAETLKLTTVAGRNRANLVDPAIPEDRSHPGKGMLLAVSALLALVIVGLWAAIEYNGLIRRNGESTP